MAVEFSDVGAPLSDEQLARIERDLDIKLLPAYRNFLLHTNGGKPHPNFFPIPEHDSLSLGRIDLFFGLGRQERQTNFDYQYKSLIGQIPPYVVPIARTVSQDIIFLALGALDEGRVYFWESNDARLSGGYDNAYVIAPNFDKFLEQLYAVS
ncbi:MAG: SMI1/KNR4 family protein [Methylovirgula sp.]